MKIHLAFLLLVWLAPLLPARAEETNAPTPREIFSAALLKIAEVIEPPPGTAPQTFSASVIITEAGGLPKNLVGQKARLAFQAPDRLLLSTTIEEKPFALGRDGQELWVHTPAKKFGVVGTPGRPLFFHRAGKKGPERTAPLQAADSQGAVAPRARVRQDQAASAGDN